MIDNKLTVCAKDKCAGCMACVDICPKGAITIEDSVKAYNAVIDEKKCINCNLCHSVCAVNNPPQKEEPKKWYQGWVADAEKRAKSSSGGFAMAIASGFIENGGVVCSCEFKNGEFTFGFAEKEEELNKFIGSKYVKSNPRGIHKVIQDYLKAGKKVLFIGLPCQVAGLKNYVKINSENLYTIDLICHGSPSPKLLESFLNGYGVSLNHISNISFRKSSNFRLSSEDCALEPEGVYDMYTHAFMRCLDYTDNCYQCQFAALERCSDITLGDSWGTELSEQEQGRGISLLLCQTEKGRELVSMINNCLKPVNIEKATEANHQLRHPSVAPPEREKFIKLYQKSYSFKRAIKKCYPKFYYKQKIKRFLIKFKIMRGGIINYYIYYRK